MMAAVLTLVLLAAPSEAVSRAHFAKAQKSFTQHDWRHALDEFTAASESAPSELPDLWFDIAQCHRNLGHQRQAAAAFTRYLALAPEAPDRDKVRSLILSLGGKLDEPPAPPPPAPALSAPAPSIDPAPLPAPAPEPAPATTTALPLVPPADAPPPPKAHRHWKVWTGVAVSVAAVALGVGLGVGLGMQSGSSSSPPVPALGSAATFDTRPH
jgi:tetratricopeptide (TPR) repeat protein